MPPTVSLTPPNSDYQLCVIKQTGSSSPPPPPPPPPPPSGGAPDRWGASIFSGMGGNNIPGSTTNNMTTLYGDIIKGFTYNGVNYPGLGNKINCWNCWLNFYTGQTFGGGTMKGFGPAFAPSTGMIGLQGVITKTRATDSGGTGIGMTPQNIVTGQFDNVIRGWVNDYANNGYKTVVYRPDYEWQITNCPLRLTSLSQVPASIAAWQYIYDKIHTFAQGTGLTPLVGWNPVHINSTNFATSKAYPGNNFCDIILLDMYCGMGNLDFSGWGGYSSLPVGGTQQLNGGSPGTQYATNQALFASADIKDAFWHFFDFPGGSKNNVRGSAATSANGATFGNEGSWGFMDVIHFAQQNNKPIGLPEAGWWVNSVTANANKANANNGGAKPTWNCGPMSCDAPSFPDTSIYPDYLTSRIAYAQSLGVTIHHVSLNMYDPNNPWRFVSGNTLTNDGRTVQHFNDVFGGTGTPLIGYTP